MNPVAPLTENPVDPVLTRSGTSVELPLAPQVRPSQDELLQVKETVPVPAPRRAPARAKRPRRYRLRGRHARERGRLRVPVALSVVPHVAAAEDRLVLQVLRTNAVTDLDSAQVAALSALPPSIAVPSLDRLVRLGLVRRQVIGGHERFGLL